VNKAGPAPALLYNKYFWSFFTNLPAIFHSNLFDDDIGLLSQGREWWLRMVTTIS